MSPDLPARRWPRPLVLDARQRRRLVARSERGYPLEACALLVGRRGDRADRVERVEPARNLERARARDRFRLDPTDWLRVEREARAEGLEVLGVWHSHPDHPALPSAADLAAAWEGTTYLITAVTAGGAGAHRAWCLAGGVFVEQPVEAGPRRAGARSS